jgi:hypothetical protein
MAWLPAPVLVVAVLAKLGVPVVALPSVSLPTKPVTLPVKPGLAAP